MIVEVFNLLRAIAGICTEVFDMIGAVPDASAKAPDVSSAVRNMSDVR